MTAGAIPTERIGSGLFEVLFLDLRQLGFFFFFFGVRIALQPVANDSL